MMLLKRTSILGSLAVLAGSLAATSVAAATSTTTTATPCSMGMFSVSALGNFDSNLITATKPPTNKATAGEVRFKPGAIKAMTYWEGIMGIDGRVTYGAYAVAGSTLTSQTREPDGSVKSTAVGGGWGEYKWIGRSIWQKYIGSLEGHSHVYGLRNDGTLNRWGSTWRKTGTYTGFASVKSMTLISQTATYDTFLANLRGGGLYTIRIPLSSPNKAVVKQVRSTGWSTYDSIVAERCGTKGVLLTAIDKDSGTANLFAIGHATGTTTVIQPWGKIPGTLANPVYSLAAHDSAGNFNGE